MECPYCSSKRLSYYCIAYVDYDSQGNILHDSIVVSEPLFDSEGECRDCEKDFLITGNHRAEKIDEERK